MRVPLFSVAIYSSVSLLFTFVKNFFLLIIIFVLCVLVLFPHVQQCITCCTAHRGQKGIRAPGTGVTDICELLGIESMSSGGALSVLNNWLISLLLFHLFNLLQPEEVEYWSFILFKYALHFGVSWMVHVNIWSFQRIYPGIFCRSYYYFLNYIVII